MATDPTCFDVLVRDDTKCTERRSMVRTFLPNVLPTTVDMLLGHAASLGVGATVADWSSPSVHSRMSVSFPYMPAAFFCH